MSILNLTSQIIGVVHSPYQQKFSIPRQPELVADGIGTLELFAPYNQAETVRGLEQFSHLWLIFYFHQVSRTWHPTVRPPRLGGNKRIGVFASRATHRPNPIGLSKVKLNHIELNKHQVLLHLGSLDLLNNTPILDIKPYLPYADSEPYAQAGFAQQAPSSRLQVTFSPLVLQKLQTLRNDYPHLQRFIHDLVAQDPRPAYQQNQFSQRVYGMSLYHFNITWHVPALYQAVVLDIE